MIPLFQIIFWNSIQESVISWVFGVFYKVNCGVDIRFLTHLFSERCLNCWLVKEIITFWVSGVKWRTLLFKRVVTWQVCEMLSDISLGEVFTLLLQLPCWSPCRDQFKIDWHSFRVWCSLIHNWITRWAPCSECKA